MLLHNQCLSSTLLNGRLAFLGPSYRYTCSSGYTDLGKIEARAAGGAYLGFLCSDQSNTVLCCDMLFAMTEGCGLLADS